MNIKKIMKQPLLVFGGIFLITTVLLGGVLISQITSFGSGGKDSTSQAKPIPPVVEETKIEYQLSDVATAYQKQIFDNLVTDQEAFESAHSDETTEAYATAVVKNFIADFYTWSNKTGRNDVGGLQFLNPEMKASFRKQAIEGFYENLDYYLKEYDATALMTVKDITISDVNLNDTIEANDETIDCITVKATWEYEISSLDEVKKFQDEATFVLTQVDEMLVLDAILAE